ncbi:MAG: hypothetical protein DHS20C17_26630 [Cyclobacteriaceae bacterium]|nr:MAG: hypothetical protein DHS20C17_26630 [Cyclobacteriaceae bacterium]
MKVLAKLLVITFLAVGSQPLLAREVNSLEALVSVKKVEQGRVQLAYYGKSPENINVQIINEKDKQVFRENIKSKRGIKATYNISELPFGTYVFKVQVASEVITHRVIHEAPEYPGNVVLQAAAIGENKVKMMILGPGYKDFKLRVYDENNRLIYQELVKQSNNFGKVLNLKGSKVNSVKLVLSDRKEILQRQTIAL